MQVVALSALQDVSLERCGCRHAAPQWATSCTSLSLNRVKFSAQWLASFTNLRYLRLEGSGSASSDTDAADTLDAILGSLQQLTCLWLDLNIDHLPASISLLSSNLQRLNLRFFRGVEAVLPAAGAWCSGLQVLSAGEHIISNSVSVLRQMPALRRLQLQCRSMEEDIEEEGMEEVIEEDTLVTLKPIFDWAAAHQALECLDLLSDIQREVHDGDEYHYISGITTMPLTSVHLLLRLQSLRPSMRINTNQKYDDADTNNLWHPRAS